jgi:hypothetical protein
MHPNWWKGEKHENWGEIPASGVKKAQIILDEVEIKSVVFFSKIDAKTGYIVLAHFNKKSLLWNQAGIRRT